MLTSPRALQPFEKDEKVVVKKERYYNINSYRNNTSNIIKETEEPNPKFKYLRGYVKRFEGEHKEKENIKEKEKEITNNDQPKEISINLNTRIKYHMKVLKQLSKKNTKRIILIHTRLMKSLKIVS
jgi:hypothetical protein